MDEVEVASADTTNAAAKAVITSNTAKAERDLNFPVNAALPSSHVARVTPVVCHAARTTVDDCAYAPPAAPSY